MNSSFQNFPIRNGPTCSPKIDAHQNVNNNIVVYVFKNVFYPLNYVSNKRTCVSINGNSLRSTHHRSKVDNWERTHTKKIYRSTIHSSPRDQINFNISGRTNKSKKHATISTQVLEAALRDGTNSNVTSTPSVRAARSVTPETLVSQEVYEVLTLCKTLRHEEDFPHGMR